MCIHVCSHMHVWPVADMSVTLHTCRACTVAVPCLPPCLKQGLLLLARPIPVTQLTSFLGFSSLCLLSSHRRAKSVGLEVRAQAALSRDPNSDPHCLYKKAKIGIWGLIRCVAFKNILKNISCRWDLLPVKHLVSPHGPPNNKNYLNRGFQNGLWYFFKWELFSHILKLVSLFYKEMIKLTCKKVCARKQRAGHSSGAGSMDLKCFL